MRCILFLSERASACVRACTSRGSHVAMIRRRRRVFPMASPEPPPLLCPLRLRREGARREGLCDLARRRSPLHSLPLTPPSSAACRLLPSSSSTPPFLKTGVCIFVHNTRGASVLLPLPLFPSPPVSRLCGLGMRFMGGGAPSHRFFDGPSNAAPPAPCSSRTTPENASRLSPAVRVRSSLVRRVHGPTAAGGWPHKATALGS